MSLAGPRAGALFVALAAALFGTVGTAQALGPESADPSSVGAVRLVLAAAVLLLLAAPRGLSVVGSCLRLPVVWAAGIAQAAFNVTFLTGVSRLGVAAGTLIAIGCTPIITGLVTRQVSRGWLGATALALLGLVLLLSGGLGGRLTWAGVGFTLGASASYAAFIIASAAIGRTGVATTPAIAAVFTVAACVLSPALFTAPLGWARSSPGATMVVYLALAATCLAYSLFNRGMKVVAASTAATLGLVEPFVASVLGVVVLEEHLSLLAWGGAALVLGALAVMVRISSTVVTLPPAAHAEERGSRGTSGRLGENRHHDL